MFIVFVQLNNLQYVAKHKDVFINSCLSRETISLCDSIKAVFQHFIKLQRYIKALSSTLRDTSVETIEVRTSVRL